MNGLDFPRLLCPGDNFRTVLWVPSQVGFSADSVYSYLSAAVGSMRTVRLARFAAFVAFARFRDSELRGQPWQVTQVTS